MFDRAAAQREMDMLRNRIQRLEAKVAAQESMKSAGVDFSKLLMPNGTYEATISLIHKRKSRADRTYWQFEFDEIEGYPGKKLWRAFAHHIQTPLEKLAEGLGRPLERYEDLWRLGSPTDLIGLRVRLVVGLSSYQSRPGVKLNEVKEVLPLTEYYSRGGVV